MVRNADALVGWIVVFIYNLIQGLRVNMHNLRIAGWKSRKMWNELREEGIFIVSKKNSSIVPFGFKSVEWTDETPDDVSKKMDASPIHLIEMLTFHTWNGRRKGTSLFIEDDSNGDRDSRKKKYIWPLKSDDVERYCSLMRSEIEKVLSFSDYSDRACLILSCRVTLLIHCEEIREDLVPHCVRICDAITKALNTGRYVQIEREKRSLYGCITNAKAGLSFGWRNAGMSEEDVWVEFAHNLLGMSIQWAHLFHILLSTPIEERPKSMQAASTLVVKTPPALVASSRKDGNVLLVHDLAEACKKARIPPSPSFPSSVPTPSTGCILHKNQPLFSEDDPNYLPFGYGRRRCPGEFLTYSMIVSASLSLPSPPHSKLIWREEWIGLSRTQKENNKI